MLGEIIYKYKEIHTMLKKRIWLILIIALGMTSCDLLIPHEVGIMIYDLKTDKQNFIPSNGMRETILRVNYDESVFYTLQRDNNSLLLRKRNYDGREVKCIKVPLLIKAYVSNIKINLSPNAKFIVYYDFDIKGLKKYDISNRKDEILIENISYSSVPINFIDFLSNDKLVMALSKDVEIGRKDNEIVIFDIINKTTELIYKPKNIWTPCSLSPNNNLFMYEEKNRPNPTRFCIINIKYGRLVKRLLNKNKGILSAPCWYFNSDIFGYADGNSVMIYNLLYNTIHKIMDLHGDVLLFELGFINNRTMYYQGKVDDKDTPITIFNIKTGKIQKEITFSNTGVNGDIFVIDNGKKLLVECGY